MEFNSAFKGLNEVLVEGVGRGILESVLSQYFSAEKKNIYITLSHGSEQSNFMRRVRS
jgi:hypothetical protein